MEASVLNRVRGTLQVIEYLDPTGQEIVHRVPEEGSGEIILGSQCVVRENQVAIFFRDGRALDMLGPGRHTLTTLNIPVLVNYLKIPFGSKSPFRAEVVFVNVKDYVDMSWRTPKAIAFRDEDLGVVRLGTQGKFAFQVGRPQLFVNQIVGTQGLYTSENIVGYLQDILVSKFADLLGEVEANLLDLPAKYDELGGGLRARASDDFEAMGLLLKSVYVTSISVPEDVERALDERAQIGALGDMQAYMQFKAARALGDAAQAGGGGEGSVAGLGVGLGAGVGLGTAMASAIGQSMQGAIGTGSSTGGAASVGDGRLEPGFANLRNLVAQQLTLSPEEREKARAALDELFGQLASSTSTIEDVKAARQKLREEFPWLVEPVKTLLNTPAALQMLGQIAARSM
jgi:membrane protease subunit (stomatin/prohibitin family)